jgi:hypothetical protein
MRSKGKTKRKRNKGWTTAAACVYAVVFWLGKVVADRNTLAAFLPVDYGKF